MHDDALTTRIKPLQGSHIEPFHISINTHLAAYAVVTEGYIHGVDHEVPYASLERDVGSVGRPIHVGGNATEEDPFQAQGLVAGKRRLPLLLLVHLNG